MADDATTPLWRAAQAFRAATLLYVVAVQATSVDQYSRPALSWVLVALLIVWSGVAVVGFTLTSRRQQLVVADQLLAIGFMLSSWLVAGPDVWRTHQSLPTTLWVSNAVLSMAIWRGPWWGLGSGVLMGLVSTLVTREISNLWVDAALPVLAAVGTALGLAAASARRSRAELERAVRIQAAAAERERLAREVHDSVLQVLALMRRRGAGATGELRELADLAGEQEQALRTLLADRPAATPDTGLLDLRRELQRVVPAGVEVSAPAESVRVPHDTGEALVGAAHAALTNAAQHAGDGARVFVLLEDLGDDVMVTVRDDGRGIPTDRLQDAEREGRMGVRRSIRGRLADIGGEARLETAPGEGTEWELRAPRDPEARSAP
ncbi:MacS family sensor histidine kinase [Barrientosiimonas humi]|uniref:MacS family sensor histidine kinase n=1 Tax=Barrientosiimonas humi TaxID=999931 RepID=UPI00370DBD6D